MQAGSESCNLCCHVAGDQAHIPTLRDWTRTIGPKSLDMIVDDGGHMNEQQYNSFMFLFQHALKPGGVYVIEVSQATFPVV